MTDARQSPSDPQPCRLAQTSVSTTTDGPGPGPDDQSAIIGTVGDNTTPSHEGSLPAILGQDEEDGGWDKEFEEGNNEDDWDDEDWDEDWDEEWEEALGEDEDEDEEWADGENVDDPRRDDDASNEDV